MIKHLFKLAWNKKRGHFLLIGELFFAYLVTCFLILFLFKGFYYRYHTINFNVDNLIAISVKKSADEMNQRLRAVQEVQSTALTNLVPYKNMVSSDSIQYKNNVMRIYKWQVDEYLNQTLRLTMESGKWFTSKNWSDSELSVVIGSALKDRIFRNQQAEGKMVKINQNQYRIIGVVKDLNDPSGVYKDRQHLFTLEKGNVFLVKLKTQADNSVFSRLKAVAADYENEFSETVIPVEQYKSEFLSENEGIVFFMSGLAGFLIINVILGIFGLLYQNINKRRSEIGLRRASGATSANIYRQIVAEVLIIATIALIAGSIVACQFAYFEVFGPGNSYYYSMLVACLIIYAIAGLCSVYPASLASRIEPAVALREE